MKPSLGWLLALACSLAAATAGARDVASLTVSSPAFGNHGLIPSEYTCEGRSVSPPFSWSAVPADTKSIAILVDDPDAPGGTFEHFIVYNLPPSEKSLPSVAPSVPAPSTRAVQVRNSAGTTGFAPICPPTGRHRYRFQVMALDSPLTLPPGASGRDVAYAAAGHILARGELIGLYQKSAQNPR